MGRYYYYLITIPTSTSMLRLHPKRIFNVSAHFANALKFDWSCNCRHWQYVTFSFCIRIRTASHHTPRAALSLIFVTTLWISCLLFSRILHLADFLAFLWRCCRARLQKYTARLVLQDRKELSTINLVRVFCWPFLLRTDEVERRDTTRIIVSTVG